MKLIKIEPSTRKYKKFVAIFEVDRAHVYVHFGDNRYEDYTMHHDKNRRANYRRRHSVDKLDDPMSPGALSMYILWGESTSIAQNLATFRRRFHV